MAVYDAQDMLGRVGGYALQAWDAGTTYEKLYAAPGRWHRARGEPWSRATANQEQRGMSSL